MAAGLDSEGSLPLSDSLDSFGNVISVMGSNEAGRGEIVLAVGPVLVVLLVGCRVGVEDLAGEGNSQLDTLEVIRLAFQNSLIIKRSQRILGAAQSRQAIGSRQSPLAPVMGTRGRAFRSAQ